MLKELFFDWETTGLLSKREPLSSEKQPRAVSLAAVLTFDRKPVHQFRCIVKPDGFVIPAEATAVHGITTDLALEVGLPIRTVLNTFDHLCAVANSIISFNAVFDTSIAKIEQVRLNRQEYFGNKVSCCMLAHKDILKLPDQYGDYKWPNLSEVCAYYGIERKDAHDALADVHFTAASWWRFKDRAPVP